MAIVLLTAGAFPLAAATDPGSLGAPALTAPDRLAAEYAACPALVDALQVFFSRDYETAAAYCAAADCDDPGAATIGAWQALALWRAGRPDAAMDAARRALALDPGCGLAHYALAQASNPQLGRHALADADTAWAHLRAAVRCDPGLPDAWTMVWVEAFKRGDAAREREALRALGGRRLYAPGLVALWRWALACLPDDALLLVNGDNDTFPLLMLQATHDMRPDVAVVNISMLGVPAYAQRIAALHDLPLPAADQVPKGYKRHGDDVVGSRRITAHWAAQHRTGSLDRPLHVAFTVPTSNLPAVIAEHLALVGATYAHDPRRPAGEIGTDADALQRNLARLDVTAATRSYENVHHLSPVTASAASIGGNLVNLVQRLIQELAVLGRYEEAKDAFRLMERIVRQGNLEAEYGAVLREYEPLFRDE